MKQKTQESVSLAAGALSPFINGIVPFSLDQLPSAQLTALTRLFDHYQLKGVAIRWNIVPTAIAVGAVAPITFTTSYDYDAGTNPVTYEDLLQRANCKTQILSAAGNTVAVAKRYFKPRRLNMVYLSPTSTGYTMDRSNAWLDIANPGIPHYGLIWALHLPAGMTFPDLEISIETTYYLGFKQVR